MSSSNTGNKVSKEEFDLWLRTKYTGAFWAGNHRFEKTDSDDVRVDNGVFRKEEAQQLFRMLTSANPFTRLNALLVIWERNGTLLAALLIIGFIMLMIVLIRVRR